MVYIGKLIGLYYRTLRHLKVRQIVWQFVYLLKWKRVVGRTTVATSRCMRLEILFLEKESHVTPCGFFAKVGFHYSIEEKGVWDNPDHDFLWKYNLHYFDYINSKKSLSLLERLILVDRWICEHRQGIGWDPYPTSLRVVNWIKFDLENDVFGAVQRDCLFDQVLHLERNIEWHIDGNHLFTNAKALLFASVYFVDNIAVDRWRRKAISILMEAGKEHFFSDGGHYERSPMYHLIILEDILDIINLLTSVKSGDDVLSREYRVLASACLSWAESMSSEDVDFPLLGDSSLGVAPLLADLRSYSRRLKVYPKKDRGSLLHSGFFNVRLNGGINIWGSCGSISPDYQPGHSHADIQSFETYSGGRCLISDSGVPTYNVTGERHRTRGSSAHNVVVIDGEDSSEVWSSFRVGRRVRNHHWESREDESTKTVISVISPHSRPWIMQRREWTFFIEKSEFSLKDSLQGLRGGEIVQFILHAGPGLRWTLGALHAELRGDPSRLIAGVKLDALCSYTVEKRDIYREFNCPIRADVIVGTYIVKKESRVNFTHEFEIYG